MRKEAILAGALLVVTSASAWGRGNALCDAGFETGYPNACWSVYDSQNSLTICDLDYCTSGDFEDGPRSGEHWLALGSLVGEERDQKVWQTVRIPKGVSTIAYWLQEGTFGPGDMSGRLDVLVDGDPVHTTEVPPAIPMRGYTHQRHDIGDYADGEIHEVMFRARTDSGLSVINWMIDDVELRGCKLAVRLNQTRVARGGVLPFRIGLTHHRVQTVEVPVYATLSGDDRAVAVFESRLLELPYGRRIHRRFEIDIPATLPLGTYTLSVCVEQMSGNRTLCRKKDVEVIHAEVR